MPKFMDTEEGRVPVLFRGYASPNYTMVPDELFDEQLADLSGAELKVLLYIIRRTFGFKKDSDNISLSQMLNGIKTSDGRILDRGVGLTKKTLLQALRSLQDQNIIFTQRRRSEEKGNEPTTYRLNVLTHPGSGKNTPPLGEKVLQGVGGEIPPSPWGKKYTTQETVKQKTVGQETEGSTKKTLQVNSSNLVEGGTGGDPIIQPTFPESQVEVRRQDHQVSTLTSPANAPPANISLGSGEEPSSPTSLSSANQARAEGDDPPTRPEQNSESEATVSDTGSRPALTSISELINRRSSAASRSTPQSRSEPRRTVSKSTAVVEDPESVAGRKKAQDRPRKPKGKFLATPYLDNVIEEFSQLDLRDPEHVASNQHQARNLMIESGIEEERFVQNFVYPARSQTKAQASVHNRGAYFFTCLRELLGLRADEAGPIPPMRSSS